MKLLSRLLKYTGLMQASNETAAHNKISADELDKAIEQVVDGVYVKIRYYPGYKKMLKKSVLKSLKYINELVDDIPGPLPASNKNFFTEPQLSAYFSTVSNMQEIFSASAELRAFFSEPLNCNLDKAYAIVCISEKEKTVFGMELNEDIIQREVRQNALSFSDHKILSPAASEFDVRSGVKQCIFDGLITHALQKILEIEEQKKGLEIRQHSLNAKLKARQSQGGGLSQLLSSPAQSKEGISLEQQISDNEKKRNVLPSSWDAPRYYLDMIRETLNQPEHFIRMTKKTYTITATGIITDNESSGPLSTVHFNEILIANVLERVVAIVSYPRNEMQDRQAFCL